MSWKFCPLFFIVRKNAEFKVSRVKCKAMNRLEGNKIQTICGKVYNISFLDQVALGVYGNDSNAEKNTFIPDTFSLYQTGNSHYILETTTYKPETNDLATSYKLLSEAEANLFLKLDSSRSVAWNPVLDLINQNVSWEHVNWAPFFR